MAPLDRVARSLLVSIHAHLLLPGSAVRRKIVQVLHPGHQAAHVTRLHRYDHSGVASVLEAEARWEKRPAEEEPHQASAVAEAEGEAASRTRTAGGRRLPRLSERQVQWLQEHHERAFVQVKGRVELEGSVARTEGHLSYRSAKNSSVGGESPAVTGLSDLNSQYVGPIGVGTVSMPTGCKAAPHESLIYLPHTEAANQSSKLETMACHAEDQSEMFLVFDTGSTNIWVASTLCKKGACAKPGRMRYDHKKSQTSMLQKPGTTLSVQFGTGKFSGPEAVDDFHVGPFTVKGQTFAMIQEMDGDVFESTALEGILGLAFPKLATGGYTPFFDTIIKQKALRHNEFAFYFSLDNPSANAVFWGGVDHKFHEGPIEFFKVTDPLYWSLALKSFRIGGSEVLGDGSKSTKGKKGALAMLQKDKRSPQPAMPKAIVDTGTTLLTAEGPVFKRIMKKLKSVPCEEMTDESHPPITFRLQNVVGELRDFELRSNEYMITDGSAASVCSPGFMQIDLSSYGPAMILGEIFLRQYFAVFDRSNGDPKKGRVGLARAAHGEHVERRLKHLTQGQPTFTGLRQ